MTVRSALQEGHTTLFYAEVDTPVLDSTVLLAEAMGVTKERLFSSLPEEIDPERYRLFRRYVDQRCSGIPVSYIRRKKEFFGLEYYVDRRVLVPRPETELLVEEVIDLAAAHGNLKDMHDACTGSGCVSIAVKKHLPHMVVSASDVSREAQAVFRINCRRILGYQLPFWISDLFTEIAGRFDLITANPPYLTAVEVDNMKRIGWPEPESALRGGTDGMAVVHRVVSESKDRLRPGGYLLVEAAESQIPGLAALMRRSGYWDVSVRRDLAGRDRVVRGKRLVHGRLGSY